MNMDQLKATVDAIVKDECSAAGQMTYGQFVLALEAMPKDDYIEFDFGGLNPTDFDSYRGFYDHVALGFDGDETAKVSDLLAVAAEFQDATMTGYKGGDYAPPHEDRPLWAANYGRSGGSRIVGVEKVGWRVLIRTKLDED